MRKSMVVCCLALLGGVMTAVSAQALTADAHWSRVAENEAESVIEGKLKILNIKTWTTLSSEEGKRLVESFGEEFLPNAFGRYEKLRDRAIELQQVFNEEFATPPAKGADTYEIYCRTAQRFAKARTDYQRAHLDMAYYILLHKAGVVTTDELGELDAKPLDVPVFMTETYAKMPEIKKLEAKQADFAAKFMPESFALHQQFAKEFAQNERLFAELTTAVKTANALRGIVFIAMGVKADRLSQALDQLTSQYNDLYMQHRLGDKSADDLAELDRKFAKELKGLAEYIPGMLREVVQNPGKGIIDDMVAIPGRPIKMGRTEVTQAQWELVMGDNPADYKGGNCPVENVSWDDCQRFIQKLNAMSKNVKFRLPTEEEWEYCCRAGGKGDWGKRKNGQEGPLDVMGWYDDNSGGKTHPVAQKEPNAWGLYDMHGNVWEWTSTADGGDRVDRGGSWLNNSRDCAAGIRGRLNPGSRSYFLGFRLVSEDINPEKPLKQQSQSAGEKPQIAENKPSQPETSKPQPVENKPAQLVASKPQTTENKPQSAQSVPNHTAAVLIEPQTMVMTAFEIFDKIKGSLPEDQCEMSEEIIALAKKLHVEELSWFAVSFTEFPNQIQAITIGYPHPLEPVMTSVTDIIDEEFEKIEIDGASEAYEVEGDITVAKVGDIVILALTRDAVEKHVKRIAKDKAAVAYAGLAPSKTGILTFKMSSMGEVMQADDGDGQVLTAINEIISVDERILKECGALTLRLTTEGATIALEAGSVEDATTIKTALVNAIPNVKTVYEQNRSELVAIPEGKRLVPAVDAAVKSLACTQQGKTVTLSIKVDVLQLAKAYVLSRFSSK